LDDADPGEADWLYRELGGEVRALDVDRVEVVVDGTAPDAARVTPPS